MKSAASPEQVIRAIAETAERYSRARLSDDLDAQLAEFTDDCVVLAPALDPLRGKAAARAFLTSPQQSEGTMFEYRQIWEPPVVGGRYAHQWGQVVSRMRLPDSRVHAILAYAIRVLELQDDGRWLICQLCWNRRTDESE